VVSTPIFLGGVVRLVVDKIRGKAKSEAESETSPGVLLASGYIAGGTLCGLIVAFFTFLPDEFNNAINLGLHLFGEVNAKTKIKEWKPDDVDWAKIVAVATFLLMAGFLLLVGSRKEKPAPVTSTNPEHGA
jgi:hypothetical protein